MSLLDEMRSAVTEMELEELQIKLEDESFRINNRNQAGFFVRKYKDAVNEETEINNMANDEIKRYTEKINAWRQKELERVEREKQFMMGLLKDFSMRELESSGKRSLKIPDGTLGFTKQQPEYSYDEDKVMEYLRAHDLTEQYINVKTVETLNKTDLKKAGEVKDGKFILGGTPVEGILVTPREDKFTIK